VETRTIERLGRDVSVVGLGTWQLGADWGSVDPDDAQQVLETAYEHGVTFYDTADAYGDGRSEQLLGEFRARHPDGVLVATKMGRRVAQEPENYNRFNLEVWNRRSREYLAMEPLDLVQLHCPPDEVYEDNQVFAVLDDLVQHNRIRAYGVSVETCAQALRAMERPNVATVQIILNCFRLKPLEQVLPAAEKAGVGIIARVPLASGLLSGRYDENTQFAADDHRNYNRHGEAFDVGETFSGVPYDVGLEAVKALREVAGDERPLAEFALRWVIDQPGVSTVIPGARNPEQATKNAAAADSPPLTAAQQDGVREVYDRYLREHVHERW
jgi:aryl-alcohol dehydrogenase-like predicted oxidoreductase